MFNYEKAIARWRRQMRAAGFNSPVPLDELENHLRDDVEQQVRAGTDEARAFAAAVQRLGPPAPLQREFKKARAFKTTLLRKLKAFLSGPGETPFPDLAAFEPEALQALQLAPDEARHLNHDFVGTEHLLLALSRSGSKPIAHVLQKFGVQTETLRLEIERIVSTGAIAVTAPTIPYTPRARKSLQLAAAEARKLNQPHIRAEHVFLGLLLEGGGVAALVLRELGVRLDTARAEILRQMPSHPGAD